MSTIQTLQQESAGFRLVGVITIGVTKIPVIGFGYPESFLAGTDLDDILEQTLSSHPSATVTFQYMPDRFDRISFSLPETDFNVFLNLPYEEERTSISLFTDTAQTQKDFLVALTLVDKTYLCFYDLTKVYIDTEHRLVEKLEGHLSKYVSGEAVPLLRTIETLKSQVAPQRKIQIPDEELGIIYQVLAGEL